MTRRKGRDQLSPAVRRRVSQAGARALWRQGKNKPAQLTSERAREMNDIKRRRKEARREAWALWQAWRTRVWQGGVTLDEYVERREELLAALDVVEGRRRP